MHQAYNVTCYFNLLCPLVVAYKKRSDTGDGFGIKVGSTDEQSPLC